MGFGGIPFDHEGVRGKGIVVGLKLGSVLWEIGIGGVEDALEEGGLILIEGTRWLVDDKELERRKRSGQTSSTVVAFVRGVAEAEVLIKKRLWLKGRWYSVRKYEAVRPLRGKKGWVWVAEKLEDNWRRNNKRVQTVEDGVGGLRREWGEVRRELKDLCEVLRVKEMRRPTVGIFEKREEEKKFVWGKKSEEAVKGRGERKGKGVSGSGRGFNFGGTAREDEEKGKSFWFPKTGASSSLLLDATSIASVPFDGKTKEEYMKEEEELKRFSDDADEFFAGCG